MKNITLGSVKMMNETNNKIKFISILSNLSSGINPTTDEDRFIDEQISKLNLLEIDTNFEIKFDL
jgi:hypothetical protein